MLSYVNANNYVKNHPAKNKILNDLVLRKKEQNAFQKRKS
jgi:hypothetical protein